MDNNDINNPTSDAGNGSELGDYFVKPPAINLPRGGGANYGVDENFQVNPFKGSASQSIPVYTSYAKGFEPNPALNYDSGAGIGLFSTCIRSPEKPIKSSHNSRCPGKPDETSKCVRAFLSGNIDPDDRCECF